MSSTHKDISLALAGAIYSALATKVTVSGVTYPVYNSMIPDAPATYIRVGEIIDRDEGTKESFIYEGTVPIIINDEIQNISSRKRAYQIRDKVRSLLKTSKSSVLTITGFTMTVFAFDVSSEAIIKNDEGKVQYQIYDIYRFIIE